MLDISICLSTSLPKSTASVRPIFPHSHYYGPNCVPQNLYVEVLTPSALEGESVWR